MISLTDILLISAAKSARFSADNSAEYFDSSFSSLKFPGRGWDHCVCSNHSWKCWFVKSKPWITKSIYFGNPSRFSRFILSVNMGTFIRKDNRGIKLKNKILIGIVWVQKCKRKGSKLWKQMRNSYQNASKVRCYRHTTRLNQKVFKLVKGGWVSRHWNFILVCTFDPITNFQKESKGYQNLNQDKRKCATRLS